jgi:hypothetical protein
VLLQKHHNDPETMIFEFHYGLPGLNVTRTRYALFFLENFHTVFRQALTQRP